jgi:hypothetical protein
LFGILSSYWLSAFYLLKKSAKVMLNLVWIADCWFSSLTSRNIETIFDFPVFLEHGSAEKIAVCAHTTRDPNKEDE